jgi:hypothetical protein
MSESVETFSRPQIRREYQITEGTLVDLEANELLVLDWVVKHGLYVTTLTADSKRVLDCAKNHLLTYGARASFAIVPFQRFLFLRFLQMPVEDIYEDLVARNLVQPSHFPISVVEKMLAEFKANLPKQLRASIGTYKAPTTKVAKRQLDIVLQVCDIPIAYAHPELEQKFAFMADEQIKLIIDAALSTRSSFAEAQKFLAEIAEISIKIEGLAFYQNLFHDLGILDRESVQEHLKAQKPSVREQLQLAIGGTLADYRTKSGIDDEHDLDQTMSVLKEYTIRELIKATIVKTPEAAKTFNAHLKSLMLIVDRGDRQKAATSGISNKILSVFSQLTVQETEMSEDIFYIQKESEDVENHG